MVVRNSSTNNIIQQWLIITHSVLSIHAEKHYDISLTVEQLKEKLYTVVGTQPDHMQLILRDNKGKSIPLTNDKATLAELGVVDYDEIHVIDNDPSNRMQAFTDVSSVKKYEISEEDYNKREDTFRKWKEKHILPKMKEKQQQQQKEENLEDLPKIGERCELQISGTPRGEVMYVGKVEFAKGIWVGVKLDEPYGKHDGT